MEHEQDDYVTVGPGIRVERHQAGGVRLHVLDMSALVRVRLTDDGRAKIRSITFGDDVDPADIGREDWSAVANRMIFDRVRLELINSTEDVDPTEWLERWSDIDASENRARRRRALTQAQLETVAEAYQAGGAAEVAHRLKVGVRQAARYVTQAREKDLL